MSTIVPILFCLWGACFTHNCCETTKQKTFSKNCITDRTNCPFLSWLSRRSFFFRCPLITEYTAEQVHNPRMSECRTPRRWSSQEVMDKLFRSDQRPCTPDGGTSGAMRARGLKDTSSRPAKDLGGTLRRTLRTTLRSYDSRASGDLFCPRRQGCVANVAYLVSMK